MKILIISPYAPERCGIANYTVQVAASLRRQGHDVEIMSQQPSAADYHARLGRWTGLLKALWRSLHAQRTVVEFSSDLMFPGLRRWRFLAHFPWVALLLGLGRGVELVIHEAPYEDLRRASGLRGTLVRQLWRLLVRLPAVTQVHTEHERNQLAEALGIPRRRVALVSHGQAFLKRSQMDRRLARRELGLSDAGYHFLCIGFLQVHKGFDRAVRALTKLPGGHAEIHVVGSMRVRAHEIEAYVGYLRRLIGEVPGANLHEGFITDELFDRWLVACDAVVLPYRHIWSSGVLERAKLYDKPVIVSDVGGLGDQASSSTYLIHNDAELAQAMAQLAGVTIPPAKGVDATGRRTYEMAVEAVREGGAQLRHLHDPVAELEHLLLSASRKQLVLLPPTGGGIRARVKQVVYRLTRWQLAPLAGHLNEESSALEAALERLARLERELEGLRGSLPSSPHGDDAELSPSEAAWLGEAPGATSVHSSLRGRRRAAAGSRHD
jgi:glycosyltransferase involved in cell wall biosynthesis